MNKQNHLIIDSSSLAHRVKYSLKDLSVEFTNTGVIYGFLNTILYLSREFETNKFVFTFDDQSYLRKQVFPDYKKKDVNKELTPEEIEANEKCMNQINLLYTDILPSLGFTNIYKQSGLEADDVIASICFTNRDKYKMTIVSNDEDLYQLLSCADMYKPVKSILYTIKDFRSEYEIHPNSWWKVKAIAGCKSDKVPGIVGVGEKTAIKYLKGQLKETTQAYSNIKNSIDIIDRNTELVRLPFPGTKRIRIKPQPKFKIGDFIAISQKYNMKSYLKTDRLSLWTAYFEMK